MQEVYGILNCACKIRIPVYNNRDMQKMKTFLHVFRKSLTDFHYYQELRKTSLIFSLQYLATLVYISTALSVIGSLFMLTMVFYPRLSSVNLLYDQITDTYPQNLVLTLKNGALRSSTESAVIIGKPFTMPNAGQERSLQGLIAVDPGASVEEYDNYKTLFVATSKGIIVYNDLVAYPKSLEQKIDRHYLLSRREGFLQAVKDIKQYLPIILFIVVPPLVLLFGLFELLAYLLLLSILSFPSWVSALLIKRGLRYSEVYRLGMHAITPMVLFNTFLSFFPFISGEWSPLLYAAWMMGAISWLTPQTEEVT